MYLSPWLSNYALEEGGEENIFSPRYIDFWLELYVRDMEIGEKMKSNLELCNGVSGHCKDIIFHSSNTIM